MEHEQPKKASRTARELIRDYSLYLLIGGPLALAPYVAIYRDKLSSFSGPYFLCLAAFLIFGEFIRENRKLWDLRLFWALVAGFFILQLSAFALWFVRGGRIGKGFIWWVLIAAANSFVLGNIKKIVSKEEESPPYEPPSLY